MTPDDDIRKAAYGLTELRLDRWLWAARFFKTRAAATEAVLGGRVRVNGRVPSPFGYRASAFEGTKRYSTRRSRRRERDSPALPEGRR